MGVGAITIVAAARRRPVHPFGFHHVENPSDRIAVCAMSEVRIALTNAHESGIAFIAESLPLHCQMPRL
jgi:hypothetical protein